MQQTQSQPNTNTLSPEIKLLIFFVGIAFLNGLSSWFIALRNIEYTPLWMFVGTFTVSTTILVFVWILISGITFLRNRPTVPVQTVSSNFTNMSVQDMFSQMVQQAQGQLPVPPAGQPQPSENPPPGAQGEAFVDFTPNFPRETFTDLQPDFMHQ